MSVPSVAVLVLNYNGLELTRRCLESVKRLTYPRYEIVVVDNASRDGSREAIPAEFPDVHFLPLDDNRGYSGGNNAGIEWCRRQRRFDAVLVLNNDTIVAPELLDRLAPHAGKGDIAAPEVRSVSDPSRSTGVIGDLDLHFGMARHRHGIEGRGEPVEVEFAGGCCLLIPVQVFDLVGTFDEDFFLYYEDADFLVRARSAGIRIMYAPGAILYHDQYGSTGAGESPLRVYYSTRNRLYFMKKHGSAFVLFALYFLAGRIGYGLRWAAMRRWSLLLAMARAVRDFFAHRMNRASYEW